MKFPKIKIRWQNLQSPVPEWVLGWVLPEFAKSDRVLEWDTLTLCTDTAETTPSIRVFEHVLETDLILRCLNFYDGMKLATVGIPEKFKGKHLVLWQSTAYDGSGNLFVPFLQNIRGQTPIMYWWWLEYPLYSTRVTPLTPP